MPEDLASNHRREPYDSESTTVIDFSSSAGWTMPLSSQTPGMFRFGVFEVDLHEGELRKSGLRIKLAEKRWFFLWEADAFAKEYVSRL
jgi:hypothetical protein